jgi:hypothetical protein
VHRYAPIPPFTFDFLSENKINKKNIFVDHDHIL